VVGVLVAERGGVVETGAWVGSVIEECLGSLGGVEGWIVSGETTGPEVPVSGGMVRMVDIVAFLVRGLSWCEDRRWRGREEEGYLGKVCCLVVSTLSFRKARERWRTRYCMVTMKMHIGSC
jgi:hypothetical protein